MGLTRIRNRMELEIGKNLADLLGGVVFAVMVLGVMFFLYRS